MAETQLDRKKRQENDFRPIGTLDIFPRSIAGKRLSPFIQRCYVMVNQERVTGSSLRLTLIHFIKSQPET